MQYCGSNSVLSFQHRICTASLAWDKNKYYENYLSNTLLLGIFKSNTRPKISNYFFIYITMLKLHGKKRQPSSSTPSTPVTWWHVTRDSQDWQGRMGHGSSPTRIWHTASTSHANTEPLALGTDSDLFSEASKSNDFLQKNVLTWSPNKFKNHALDIFLPNFYIKHFLTLEQSRIFSLTQPTL